MAHSSCLWLQTCSMQHSFFCIYPFRDHLAWLCALEAELQHAAVGRFRSCQILRQIAWRWHLGLNRVMPCQPELLTLAGYLFGVVGQINQPCIGYVEEPDIDAFHYVDGPKQPTYRVTFHQKDLWEGYQVNIPSVAARLPQVLT